MKICIISLFLLLCLNSFSQDYVPFPDSIAMWNVEYSGWDDFGEDTGKLGITYRMEGDTIVNDTLYSKLYIRNSWEGSWGLEEQENLSILDYPYRLIGGVREDANKKVWYLNLDFDNWWYEMFGGGVEPPFSDYIAPDSTEMILYDFDMDIGDSTIVTFHGNAPNGLIAVVNDVYIDDFERRNINFGAVTFGDDYIWVEGMGSLYGGLFSMYETVGSSLGHSIQFTCFSLNDEITYMSPNYNMLDNCEGIFVGVNEEEILKLDIYPNPSNDFIIIEGDDLPAKTQVVIYDFLGKSIAKHQLRNGGRVEVDKLSPGLYLMILFEDGKAVYKEKIVVE